MKLGWLVFSAVIGFFIARHFTRIYLKKNKSKKSDVSNERLMQSRNQTMRINELWTLKERLKKSNFETHSLEKSVQRWETVLTILEELIENNQTAHSESLLTRFSKHLRHLLHERANPTLSIEENTEYVEGSLALMSAMNQHSWAYEINKEMIIPLDFNRKVKTIVLTTWVFDKLWDFILKNGVETSVDLKLISDTYKITAILRFNQQEESLSLDLLA